MTCIVANVSTMASHVQRFRLTRRARPFPNAKPDATEAANCDVLGLSPHADLEEITLAFRRRAMRYHPDRRGGGDAVSDARYMAMRAAYEALKPGADKSPATVLSDDSIVPGATRWYELNSGGEVLEVTGAGQVEIINTDGSRTAWLTLIVCSNDGERAQRGAISADQSRSLVLDGTSAVYVVRQVQEM